MRLSISLTALVAMLAIPACGFQAFSGTACDGAAGLIITCDGSCYVFDGRHSFREDSFSDAQSVVMFVDTGCGGQFFNFITQAAECTHVNTGTNITSFRCSGPAPASPPTPLLPSSSTDSGSQDMQSTASVPFDPPADASTPSMLLWPTGSGIQNMQSTASVSTAPPVSAPSASYIPLSTNGSGTQNVPPASSSTNNKDSRGKISRTSVGAIASAAVSGGVATLLIVCTALWCYKRRSRRQIEAVRAINNPNEVATPYSDHTPLDGRSPQRSTPISSWNPKSSPAVSSIPPSNPSDVSWSPRSDTDLESEVAQMRIELERLRRIADHDTPPRYEDSNA